MSRFLTSACVALLALLVADAVQAAVITIEGTVKSVDAKKRTITVQTKTKTLELDVSRKAKISLKSKTAELDSLKPGQKVKISYHDGLEIVLKITATDDNDGFVSLFDGKTLKGWKGNQYWKVINGAIVGECPAQAGGYLVSLRQYKNFVLKLKFKLHRGNSGISFRSHQRSDGGVIGSQAEICHVQGLRLLKGKDLVTGAVFGEGNRRGVIADMPESLKPKILASTRKANWSDYVITAQGDRIAIEVNGYTTVDFRDAKGEKEGSFGLQLHRSGTKISFKDIFIKELPE